MHETAMAQQIVRTVLAEMESQRAIGVRAIEVVLGGLEPIRLEALREAFELEAAGTPAEGAELRASRAAGTARCAACGRSWELGEFHSEDHGTLSVRCPSCSAPAALEGSRGLQVRRATLILRDG